MYHNSVAVLAISKEPNPTVFQRRCLNDFYFGMDGFEYPMGNIQMVGKSRGPMYRARSPSRRACADVPPDDVAKHAVTSGSRPRTYHAPRIGSRWRLTARSA